MATRPGLDRLVFPWAIACATGLEYFDSALFSFFASYIAGGVNASPDELVWAATSYATAAVLGIVQQQWWVERLGYRRYLAVSLLAYALGALASALCQSSIELALARAWQGYWIGPLMGACRILIQNCFPGTQRAGAIRIFLVMILIGSAGAPLAGSILLDHAQWRMLFACTAPLACLFALAVWLSVPPLGVLAAAERGEAHVWPYLVFAIGQGALQIVLQQLRFTLFTGSPLPLVLTALAVAALGWFGYHQWRHPRPLMRLDALRERSYRTGLTLYVLYYFLSTSLSYLLPRFMEQGLGWSVFRSGELIGVTSLTSLALLFGYLRISPRITRKKWLIVPGFICAATTAFWLASMTPQVGPRELAGALLLRSLLILFIVLPVANLTFRPFTGDAFSHGYRMKNVVKQLTISFSTASVIVLEQHRAALHHSRLAEVATPYNPVFRQTLDALAGPAPLAEVAAMVTRQAAFMASLDAFVFVGAVAALGGLYALLQRDIK
ncbi:MFS transporter [Chitinasiproducens palmae]|uniref:Major Facilitator Superfamily protein n=1 Tax=Chitinasiproducens palmae TaxID=1770053 RepID=A0A1H2PNX5_9BURK|nr:MFS transporter [Chitinasiproducens palmae]SDV47563.1 Major Facilitator Superfamily protein [Chitinasiproducens palmae]